MWILLCSVHLLDGSLEGDAEAAPLLELAHLRHHDLKLRAHHLAPVLTKHNTTQVQKSISPSSECGICKEPAVFRIWNLG